MDSPEDLSTDLGRLRALVAWGQTTPGELSRLCGLASPAHLGMVLRGDIKSLSTDTARKVAPVVGCTVGWLLAGEGDAPSADEVRAAVGAAQQRAAAPEAETEEPRSSTPAAA